MQLQSKMHAIAKQKDCYFCNPTYAEETLAPLPGRGSGLLGVPSASEKVSECFQGVVQRFSNTHLLQHTVMQQMLACAASHWTIVVMLVFANAAHIQV